MLARMESDLTGALRRKKRWSEFSRRQRQAILVGAALEIVMTKIALRDLVRRPKGQVRGPKAAWALALFVQPVGPISYFLFGRRS